MSTSPGKTLAKSSIAVIALGFLFTLIGLQFGPAAVVAVIVLFALAALATDAAGNVSTAFVVVLFALVVLLVQTVAPAPVRNSVCSLASGLGFPVCAMDGGLLLFWAVVAILGAWIIDIRFISQTAKKPDTVAKRVSRRAQRLVDEYATLGRVMAVGAAGIIVVVLEQFGLFSGEITSLLAQSPALVANVITGLLGFLALGGSLPVVGQVDVFAGLDPVLWVVFVAVLLLLAWGVRNQ